ncbi:RES family NAD+ phosphorylase, partial [Vibrio sp. 10N.222.48.A4]
YVGDTIAVGSFITKKTLTFFDFTLLDSAKLKSASILTSPKQDKFYQHGYLLNTLHELISKPFRATSLNYIQTQMFAETIRNYDNGMFDGIIFKSSQLEGGINYVIFGDETEGDSDSIEYNVEFDTQTGVEFYQVEAMTPSIKEVGIHSRNSDNILVNV